MLVSARTVEKRVTEMVENVKEQQTVALKDAPVWQVREELLCL